MRPETILLDLDGTLVDTNYHHVLAWGRAFREHGFVLPLWRVHRALGMGGDNLIEHVLGAEVEQEHGEQIRASEGERYQELIGEVEPLEGAHELLRELRQLGLRTVLASSGKEQEVEHYLDLLDARELVDGWTTSAEVESTKPSPDVVLAVLDKAGTRAAVMVGDATWDVVAATKAGIPTICLMTGGFGHAELLEAGALAVVDTIEELRARLRALASG